MSAQDLEHPQPLNTSKSPVVGCVCPTLGPTHTLHLPRLTRQLYELHCLQVAASVSTCIHMLKSASRANAIGAVNVGMFEYAKHGVHVFFPSQYALLSPDSTWCR
jgi:hypothetical protein